MATSRTAWRSRSRVHVLAAHGMAFKGDAHAVAAWLDEGGGVDARCSERGDSTLLMAAALGGQKAVVRVLLQRGASVNLQGSNGATALMAVKDPMVNFRAPQRS